MSRKRRTIPPLFIALFLIFTFLSTAAPTADSPQAVLLALLKQKWPKVSSVQNLTPPSFWSYQLSPAFPCEWPAAASKKICYYGFATRIDPQLSDGLRIAAPWAKISVTDITKTTPQLEILNTKIQEIGIQGVRPLRKEEAELAQASRQVEGFMIRWINGTQPLAPEELNQLKAYYRQWRQNNAVLAKSLQAWQASFFSWLES